MQVIFLINLAAQTRTKVLYSYKTVAGCFYFTKYFLGCGKTVSADAWFAPKLTDEGISPPVCEAGYQKSQR